jgi:hypothetical protein
MGICPISHWHGVLAIFTSSRLSWLLSFQVVSVAMYLDPYVWVRLLGKAGWRISYYFIIVVQPIGLLIGATGATILVRWLTKRSNQPLQPTAGRRDDQIQFYETVFLVCQVRRRQRWLSSVSLDLIAMQEGKDVLAAAFDDQQ